MKGVWTRLRSAWLALWRSTRVEAEMREEIRFHVEMEAERLARDEGLDAREARRQAHIRFGGIERYKEQARDVAGVGAGGAAALLLAVAVVMLLVGLLAALGPARRSLRIQANEALRSDGLSITSP